MITRDKYFNDLELLELRLIPEIDKIDAIVALKRSGLIMGVYLSNRLKKPLFVTSEIDSIPSKFINILLVDDKTYTGRSIRHWAYKLYENNKKVISATIYVEQDYYPSFYVEHLGEVAKMFYEIQNGSLE